MRHVEFTQNLAEHLAEIVIVVDMRQERLVVFLHLLKIHPMVVFHEETLLDLEEDMIEHIFALCGEVELHGSVALDGGRLAAFVDFLHVAARKQEQVVAHHLKSGTALAQFLRDLHRLVAHVHLPKVVAFFEGGHEIELLAVLGECHPTQVRRHRGQSHHTVLQVFQIHLDFFDFFVFLLLFVVFLFVLLIVFCLIVLLGLFQQGVFFLVESELVVGILIQESDEGVVLAAP